MKFPHVLVPFVVLLCAGTSLHATLVATEDFEDKSLATLEGQGGGAGFTGTWTVADPDSRVTVVNSSLTYSNGAVSAGGGSQALQFQWEADEGITDGILSRALTAPLSGTVYMSLLFRETVNDDTFSLGSPNDFIQWGFNDTAGGNPKATILRRNGELQARSNTSAGNSAGGGDVSVLNQTRLLVFKATRGGGNYDSISLFVDPSSLTETAADATSSHNSTISSFSHFVARSAFHETGDTFLIDNIRVGTTWESVVISEPAAPFVISEIVYDADADAVTLTWRKSGAASYTAMYSLDMVAWDGDIGDGLTADQDERLEDPDHITMTLGLFGLAADGEFFIRIEEE